MESLRNEGTGIRFPCPSKRPTRCCLRAVRRHRENSASRTRLPRSRQTRATPGICVGCSQDVHRIRNDIDFYLLKSREQLLLQVCEELLIFGCVVDIDREATEFVLETFAL